MQYKIFLFLICLCSSIYSQKDFVSIAVDITKDKGPMKHIWTWFGYDEQNYTYLKNGNKLLSELADLLKNFGKNQTSKK
jgi:xylan 1,4-beta-xylosidase